MTEYQQAIVNNLVKKGTIKFCVCYLDDTLLLFKRQYLHKVLKPLNKLDKKLTVTENKTPDFLDLEI